ncbi:hypothetical protein A7U60_g8074 [Sanghuangporus baumii]|uniref:Uncharacterized protein n=1 Tax=Sanghuangporus baumii TaxID=108892 RepID=A0A9Q5HRW0_SANBA|nr:hypothetical protein A7U60_g8074 [Sanghuangporus baumii]
MTDPSSDDHTPDGPRRPTGSSSSVIRSPRKSAPPSAPLPPLPKGAMSPYQKPGVSEKDPSSSAHKSSGQSGTALVMAADMAQKHSVRKAFSPFVLSLPQPSLAEQKLTNEARRSTLETQGQVINDELRVKDVPASSSHRRGVALDPPPPKTGLLKRLTTRLAGTRSSPSLRPLAASSEECLNVQHLETPPSREEQREHEKPSQAVTPVPVRAKPPVPDDKPRPPFKSHQSLSGRLSLAARAEKRAEKRDAKAREDQRATDARRAAALAKTGLLPASRRYSVVPTPFRANEQGCARTPPFDPFAKDRIQHETGSDGDFIVEEGASPQENQGEGGLSAAEVVIREWRERNARADKAKGKPQSRGPEDEQNLAQDECRDISKTSSVTDCDSSSLPSVSRDPESAPPTSAPEVDMSKSQEGQLPTTVNQQSTSQSIEKSVPTDTSPEDVICGSVTPVFDQTDSVLPPPPPPKKLHSARKDTEKRRRDGKYEENDPRNDISDKTVGEKVALGNWRFPATTSSTASDSTSAPTPRGEKLIDDGHPFSPASSGSGSPASTSGARVSKPSRPEGAPLASPSAWKKEALATQDEKCQEDTAAKACSPATLSPTQIRLPASPGFHAPSPRSCHRASTAPPAPFQHSRSQKPVNRPSGSAQALTVSLPALSPTASTSTSTSGGSALPRTPSTSSHGHSPVRLLVAPLENEENAPLLRRPVLLPSITDPEPEPEPESESGPWNKTGVEEFGQLARLADLDLERSDCGALPPSSFGPSRNKPFGNAATPIAEHGRQKRTTVFGRRRTTQNNLPMITILESHSSAGNGLGSGQNADVHAKQPRYVSSFTSLRRTVTSVTTGLAGAAGATIRDRSPLRTSTTWSSRPPASPRSNASGTSSLSPTDSAVSTPNQRVPGVGLRPRPLNPTIHSRGSILMETHAIEDAESRRLAELAFLD